MKKTCQMNRKAELREISERYFFQDKRKKYSNQKIDGCNQNLNRFFELLMITDRKINQHK